MYIKISVDTIWSCLGKCELSANLAERTNIYTDNRGIKSLSAGVILCLMVFTHSFAMSSKKLDERSHFNTAVHMGFLSVSHMHQVLQCLVILVSLSWSGCQDGLEAGQCIRLGVSLIQIKSNSWSRGVTRGLTMGFRIPLFGALIPCLSPGVSTVRDLWLCPAHACNPVSLLSTDWTLRLLHGSLGMCFLIPERAHQLRWLCLKAELWYVQRHFILSPHDSQSMASFAHHSCAAAHGPAAQVILACGRAARVAEGQARAWKLGS